VLVPSRPAVGRTRRGETARKPRPEQASARAASAPQVLSKGSSAPDRLMTCAVPSRLTRLLWHIAIASRELERKFRTTEAKFRPGITCTDIRLDVSKPLIVRDHDKMRVVGLAKGADALGDDLKRVDVEPDSVVEDDDPSAVSSAHLQHSNLFFCPAKTDV